jgi:hypothetical protein
MPDIVLRNEVLTVDRPLRTAAEVEGQTVHGVRWVLDQLVEQAVIRPPHAAGALDAMVQQEVRLPEDEVQERVYRWRGG